MNATFFFFFFIPGDTISCNVTYPGRPGPPGFDGAPGMINEKLNVLHIPQSKRTSKTDEPIARHQATNEDISKTLTGF